MCIVAIYTVSYTHLDVYKRQGLGSHERQLQTVQHGWRVVYEEGSKMFSSAFLHIGGAIPWLSKASSSGP